MNEKETAFIHALSHDGRGIASINNKTTFISGALPNETITYRITQKHSNYNEAQLLSVLETAHERIAAPCPHFGVCGGCSLQHMSLETQLLLKEETLLQQLKHFGKVTPKEILPPLNASTFGYRRKARLGVKFVIKKDKLLVGFREKSSRYLADLSACEVLHPNIGKRFSELSTLVLSLSTYRELPQIEVAIGDTDQALVFRHLAPLSNEDKEKLITFGKNYQFDIYLQPNSKSSVHKIWPNTSPDRLSYSLPDYNLQFLFHPLDFTQINLELNRLMVKQAISLLDLSPTDRVLDLFCGIGNFTLALARFAHEVIGIEGEAQMVERAYANAALNKINNANFYTANLFKPEKNSAWLKNTYDKILLDPPRAGAKEVLPYLKQLNAKKVMYISCNPATLARDAHELVHLYGYELKQTGIMNMFPHTSHIEAMAVFEKT